MRNADFRRLVDLLQRDPEMLRDLLIGGVTTRPLRELLSDQDIANIRNMSKEARLANVLLSDDPKMDRWSDELPGRLPDLTPADIASPFECTTTCGVESCSSTYLRAWQRRNWAINMAGGLSCDGNVTCSCTTGTCGGVTCGGSTCSVTCSGDSCGNTCGDSCGTTTNLTWEPDFVFQPWQFSRWR
jgi:hypothetical protein